MTTDPSCLQAIIHHIHNKAMGHLNQTFHQLSMGKFLLDLQRYMQELTEVQQNPCCIPLTLSTPSASSDPLNAEELEHTDQVENWWTSHHREGALAPGHPHYHKACFKYWQLGHLHIDCHWYQYPLCLCISLGHTQSCCPAHHLATPTMSPPTSSPTTSHSSHSMHSAHTIRQASTVPIPVPPPHTIRTRPTIVTTPPSPHCCHPHIRSTMLHHNLYSHTPSIPSWSPTLDNGDDMYGDNAYANMTGSPVGGSHFF